MADIEEYYKSLFEDEKKSISIKEILQQLKIYWDYLWSKKWIIISCGVVFGLLGLTYTIIKKVNYTASYVFTIEGGASSNSSGLSSITGLFGLGGSSMGAFSGDNLVELLKSRRLIEKALLSPIEVNGKKETFMEYYINMDSLRKDCGKIEPPEGITSICDIYYPLGQERNSFSRAQDSLLLAVSAGFVKENIAVAKRDKKLAFVEFSVTSSDEIFSKFFSKALLGEVSAFYIDTKTALSKKNIESFQLQADSVRKELDKALSSRAYYADENINAAKQIVGVQLQKKQTDIQIYGTAYAEMIKNIEMLKLDLARETPLIQIIDEPVLPLENDKMRKLKGLILGGFLGGFLSSAFFVIYFYIGCLLKKEKENTNSLATCIES